MDNELYEMTKEELGRLFPITLTGWDPAWPHMYELEKDRIISAAGFRSFLAIHHIGSTAIPGLPAKPTVDILLQVQCDADLDALKAAMENLGYYFSPQPQNPAPHMMFMKGYTRNGYAGQAFHVHVRYKGVPDEVYFRDYLIAYPDVAQAYASLKRRLQAQFEFDRDKYTDAKTGFVRMITQTAKDTFLSIAKKNP